MQIFSDSEGARAQGLIASIIDGYEGTPVGPTLDLLLTDVDDWEALSLELAAHAACVLIALANILKIEPYLLFSQYVVNRPGGNVA